MGLNRTTPKRAMRYWRVGWNGVVIKARTARVAVRKWLRDNATYAFVVRDGELDNRFGSGAMPGEIMGDSGYGRARAARRDATALTVADVPVCEVVKGSRQPSAPDGGAFWRGFNRRR